MIYELALIVKAELPDAEVANLSAFLRDVISKFDGEVLIEDDWGVKSFAQTTSNGIKRGRYLYSIYKANSKCNVELERRFKINEEILKSLIVKLGEEDSMETILKSYKTPFSQKYNGSVTDEINKDSDDDDGGPDRRKFTKSKSCWFKANKIKVDWKDRSF